MKPSVRKTLPSQQAQFFRPTTTRYKMALNVVHERPTPVQEQHPFPFLREILLFLSLAGILIPTLQRLRINQVLGFLAVGALVGPFGLGLHAAEFPWLAWLT